MEYFLVFLAALARVLPHPPNVTPVGTIALFGGAFLSRRWALLYPLAIMTVSDALLRSVWGVPTFFPESLFVYGSFVIGGLLGFGYRTQHSRLPLWAFSLVNSVQFFLLTNFGTWLSSGMYPQNVPGLLDCYTLALPFFRNTVLGDLAWLSLLAGAYHLSRRLLLVRRTV